ncbi:MAG: hypothetical protein Q9178_005447 [Gyalolechia marmorata]
MDISNQNGDAAEKSPSPAHQPNGHQSSEPSSENHHPKSPSNEQLHTGIDSEPAPQPKGENNNSQGNGNPETQPPTSGQGNGAEKEPINPSESLEPFGWDDLEERFLQKMEECRRQEAEIEKEFREWCEVFQAWASVSRNYEEERLHKRLKTRMAWVQMSESTLEEKRQQHIKVVKAFENALTLLDDL